MKKIKNIIFYSLFSIALILGVTNVEAKSYTSYNAGDKITVKVNDNTNLDFYVMEDSDDENNTVKGLSYNFVDDNIYTFAEAETKINELKISWTGLKTLSIPDVQSLLGQDVTLNDETSQSNFTSPTWVSPVTSDWKQYWLSDVPFQNYHAVISGLDTRLNSQFHVVAKKDTEKNNIRVMVTVSKENVIGGITVTEDDKIWENFVSEFKKTSVIEYLEDAGNTINITSTDNTLKIEMSDGTNNWTTNFTYANGILTYVPSISDENKLIDSIWVGNAVSTLATIKGYDQEKLSAWLESKNNFDLIKDGIEFIETEIETNESGSGVDFSMTSNAFSSFKLDIKNGLKTFKSESGSENSNEQNEVVKNPKTGLFTGVGVAGTVGVLSFGAYLILKKKNAFPKA